MLGRRLFFPADRTMRGEKARLHALLGEQPEK